VAARDGQHQRRERHSRSRHPRALRDGRWWVNAGARNRSSPCPPWDRLIFGSERMPQLKVGSDEHKQVFCREFVETHHAYAPEDLQWPDLAPAEVERLRNLPFWGEAIGSERTAAARVRAMADVETDPIMREAIAMQAYEEE